MKNRKNGKFKIIYYRYLWWPWQLFLVAAAIFFTVFGFLLLFYAYEYNDPFLFIMIFFSSNLIILISLVMVIAFVLRMIKVWRVNKENEEEGKG
ncbi:MAG: hypothetical protein R6T92_01110 [Desulfosalsimonadaceae bacterium]